MQHLTHVDEDLKHCIEECRTCREVCLSTAATHCLEMGGEHVAPDHFRLMMDCAEICGVATDFMLRNSPRHALTCGVCAEICAACADDCERIGEMESCVEVCRRCAESCRKMAA
jgi:hypothetical protein